MLLLPFPNVFFPYHSLHPRIHWVNVAKLLELSGFSSWRFECLCLRICNHSYIIHTCETQVQEKKRDGPPRFEKTRWKTKNVIKQKQCDKWFCHIAAPTASFSVKSGHHGFRELVLWKQKGRGAGSWNSWAMATHAGHVGFKILEKSVRKFPRYSRKFPR